MKLLQNAPELPDSPVRGLLATRQSSRVYGTLAERADELPDEMIEALAKATNSVLVSRHLTKLDRLDRLDGLASKLAASRDLQTRVAVVSNRNVDPAIRLQALMWVKTRGTPLYPWPLPSFKMIHELAAICGWEKVVASKHPDVWLADVWFEGGGTGAGEETRRLVLKSLVSDRRLVQNPTSHYPAMRAAFDLLTGGARLDRVSFPPIWGDEIARWLTDLWRAASRGEDIDLTIPEISDWSVWRGGEARRYMLTRGGVDFAAVQAVSVQRPFTTADLQDAIANYTFQMLHPSLDRVFELIPADVVAHAWETLDQRWVARVRRLAVTYWHARKALEKLPLSICVRWWPAGEVTDACRELGVSGAELAAWCDTPLAASLTIREMVDVMR